MSSKTSRASDWRVSDDCAPVISAETAAYALGIPLEDLQRIAGRRPYWHVCDVESWRSNALDSDHWLAALRATRPKPALLWKPRGPVKPGQPVGFLMRPLIDALRRHGTGS